MKIHSAPVFESSSLKTRFSSNNAKILDQKQKRRKKRSLETQGMYIETTTSSIQPTPPSCHMRIAEKVRTLLETVAVP